MPSARTGATLPARPPRDFTNVRKRRNRCGAVGLMRPCLSIAYRWCYCLLLYSSGPLSDWRTGSGCASVSNTLWSSGEWCTFTTIGVRELRVPLRLDLRSCRGALSGPSASASSSGAGPRGALAGLTGAAGGSERCTVLVCGRRCLLGQVHSPNPASFFAMYVVTWLQALTVCSLVHRPFHQKVGPNALSGTRLDKLCTGQQTWALPC